MFGSEVALLLPNRYKKTRNKRGYLGKSRREKRHLMHYRFLREKALKELQILEKEESGKRENIVQR